MPCRLLKAVVVQARAGGKFETSSSCQQQSIMVVAGRGQIKGVLGEGRGRSSYAWPVLSWSREHLGFWKNAKPAMPPSLSASH